MQADPSATGRSARPGPESFKTFPRPSTCRLARFGADAAEDLAFAAGVSSVRLSRRGQSVKCRVSAGRRICLPPWPVRALRPCPQKEPRAQLYPSVAKPGIGRTEPLEIGLSGGPALEGAHLRGPRCRCGARGGDERAGDRHGLGCCRGRSAQRIAARSHRPEGSGRCRLTILGAPDPLHACGRALLKGKIDDPRHPRGRLADPGTPPYVDRFTRSPGLLLQDVVGVFLRNQLLRAGFGDQAVDLIRRDTDLAGQL